jgi:integrase/recombinase XerC/integrase/recombinase XerD
LRGARRRDNTIDGAPVSVSVADVRDYAEDWILDGEIQRLSPNTLRNRRQITDKLLWFLQHEGTDRCDAPALRRFFAHIETGHKNGGRWGNPRNNRPPRPRTSQYYWVDLRALFGRMVADGLIEENPVESIPKPKVPEDHVVPFTPEQVQALLTSAARSESPTRNRAILLLLLDTGLRVSELCNLRREDVDLQTGFCTVTGKGNKVRQVVFYPETKQALWRYLRENPRDDGDPLFTSEGGRTAGSAMTRNGVALLFRRLGTAAKLKGVRCSPHTCRHTFAVETLRAGRDVFSLRMLLGHTTLTMVNKYLALAQSDLRRDDSVSSVGRLLRPGRGK